jgi:hypothetical protein
MKSLNISPHTDLDLIGGKYLLVDPLLKIIAKFKQKITEIKQNICEEIWKNLANGDCDSFTVNDQVWQRVRNPEYFSPELSTSLIKFLSSKITQTVSFKFTKTFFMFNLSAACDQKKFFLDETLLK